MTTGGWLSLILSVGGVTSLLLWCIVKVLTTPEPEHQLGPVEPARDDRLDER